MNDLAFNLRLTVRSMRWLGPVLIALIWTMFTIASPGTALGNASNAFLMLVAVTCWLTVAIGNVDGDGHRELLAAAAGSPARLQRVRAGAAYLAGNAVALVITVVGIALATNPSHPVSQPRIIVACVLVQLAATAIGVGIGTLLHRPVVRNGGVTLLASAGALVVLILLPPVQRVLRELNDDRTDGLVVLTVVALAAGIAAVAVSGALADRLN
jgi:hypothetical protein